MTPERFHRIEQLVSFALERTASRRAELIRQACRGDDELRIEVESLLVSHQQHQQQDEFLGDAPIELAAELVEAEEEEEVARLTSTASADGLARGRFKLIGPLGTGGMGVVFAAHDSELGRKVAIKFVRPQTSQGVPASESRERLMREARAMAQISHPNVVAVHDVGTLGDQMFVAMEYVEGGTLGQWLAERSRPWRQILGMFIQAGRGLAAAHAVGILHRDFKPENVLVGKDGRGRVVDFGLARSTEPGEDGARNTADGPGDLDSRTVPALHSVNAKVTQRGSFVGTPAYMAPEQLRGESVDEKTDQYSFCVALFKGLCGELPFNAENLAALLDQIEHCRVSEVSKLNHLPSSFRHILLRGLSPDRADRYPSMEALLEELERVQSIRLRRQIAGEWLTAASGALSVAFGVLLLTFPGSGTLAREWMIGAYAMVFGVLLIGLGLWLGRRGRSTLISSGGRPPRNRALISTIASRT